MNFRRALLNLESLEARDAPSSLQAGPPAETVVTAPIEVVHIHHHAHLAGVITGHFVKEPTAADSGKLYELTGTADLGTLGEFDVTGSLRSTGFTLLGEAKGTLTLTNAEGSLTIKLQGPLQLGLAPLPHEFHYQVVGGTGAYAADHASGDLHLVLPAGHSSGNFSIHFQR